ncbi:probable ATP-dependent RNA helicase spindle-E [Temnothorax curvispinosus]|uniref:Probable ATP-dependent RNA helicase spindle-E n=1 Tax=Temnothorax curvispinosus TaxID=300111 RepID=A0A6J1QGX9_9HYME|nr:probable ATP-dependent RNA helicase spindle-E [Temnothorax curvispinosus]XP_024881593.1 probable ATP-dependent RNA helicase spindle-E [Temnothorax curvispinosus]XP_024881594.1 probable ATP-dependent RNA helicase spindle-E [Temnothorax curvispinosus]
MDDSLVNRILNMYKSPESFSIDMPAPTIRKVKKNSFMFDEELGPHAGKKTRESETNYVKEYVQKDEEEYIKLKSSMLLKNNDHMDNVSEVSGDTAILKQNTVQLYRSYNFAYRPNTNLPIFSVRHKVVSMIASNSVVIIRGSTGCGKTTQVPQLILDAEFEKKQHCNIIVTQPRRIAALSIAKRVSAEREWPVGTLVGYEMGLIKNVSRDTRITYCTTGVLLNRLANKKHMMDYTHVILDEVHERDEDMDFLLLVVRKLLRTNSTTVKVILMSATIDVDKFSAYFSTPVGNRLASAPIIDIPKGSPYDISIYYIDEMENLGNIPQVDEEPKFTTGMAEFAARIIRVFDSIDKKNDSDEYERATVLVFLPGFGEIEELRTAFLSSKHEDANWDIIILHSLISTEEQENIFKKPPKNFRRIILSTNIAESSITVPNVKYVIDFCLTKLLVTEPGTNYQCLQLCWASKSNCQQRAGRTGRVMDGRVYRMVPRAFYENVLQEESLPEMLRAPLANVILKTKVLEMGEPKALLALSLDPPNLSNIQETILLLKEVGALLNKGTQEFDGDLTPLGRVMASLPLDVRVTKLIVLGHLFGVLSDTIILAASMAVKDMFNIGFFELESTYHEKLHWAANSESDSIAYLNAFKVWRNDKASRRINSPNEEREWARRKSLRVRSLREIDAFIYEITQKLRNFGITETMGSEKNTWESLCIDRTFVLKFIIAGAFYPNYFIKFPHNINDRKRDIERTLGYRDPTNTVVLHGWPLEHPGSLYSKRFQEIFGQHMGLKNQENITVSFDGSNRVYIEYEPKNRAPDDYTFVRDCVKMRHCRNQIEVKLLSETDARHRAEELGLTKEYGTFLSQPSNPEEPPCRRYMYDKKPYPDLPEDSEYRSKVKLQGPFSPVEVRLTHMVTKGMAKVISLESTSVNSVLLDTCPDSPKGLFLVAQNISRDSKNMSHLILRNTTLLPTTPGLASLVTLIFTPYMELRRSPMGTYYTGALCGLGYNRITEQSLFPDHDLEIIFDVEITMNDLRMINKLRHWMNVAMHFNNRSEILDDEAHHDMTINCQNQIKNAFKDVIYKTRKKIEPVPVSNFNKWNRYDETLFLVPARETSRKSNVYGLHKALELNEKNDRLEEIIKHLLELEALAHQDPREATIAPVYCKLCLTEVNGIINLRAHLCSEQHTARQRMIDTTAEFGENLHKLMETLRL